MVHKKIILPFWIFLYYMYKFREHTFGKKKDTMP